MDKKHETNKQIKKFNATKKKYNHPEILDKILKHYGRDKFITVNKTKGAPFPMLDINTPFINNVSDSITLSLVAPNKNTVNIIDNGFTIFNIQPDANELKKFLEDSEVKNGLNLYQTKFNSRNGILYLSFNFRKSYYMNLKADKGNKNNTTRDMWISFENALASFIDAILFLYTMNDLVIDKRYKLDDK